MQQSYKDQKQINNDILFEVTQQYFEDVMHRSIGALTFRDKFNRLGKGTATLISKDIILTVAHNIYDKEYGYEYTQFKFYLAPHKVAEDYYEIQSWRYLPQFKDCLRKERIRFDFAIMKLKTKIEKSISYNEFLSLESICLKCQKQLFTLSIFGYPSEQPGYPPNYIPLDPQFKKFKINQYGLTCEKRVISIDFSQLRLTYSMNTYPGQSGSAIISNNRIIAVHNAAGNINEAFNIGRIMSTDVINILRQWCEEVKGQSFKLYEHLHQNNFINLKIKIKHKQDEYTFSYMLIRNRSVRKVLEEVLQHPRFYYCLMFQDFILKPEDSFNMIQNQQLNPNSGLVEFSVLKDSARFYLFTTIYNKYKDQPLDNTCDPNDMEKYKYYVIKNIWTSNQYYITINKFLRQTYHSKLEVIQRPQNLQTLKLIVEIIKVCNNIRKSEALITYRGISNFFLSSVGSQKENNQFHAFTTTSLIHKMAIDMIGNKGVGSLLTVNNFTGKQISKYSRFPGEKQVLLMPFTKFYIEQIKKDQNREYINLIELSGPISYSGNILIWIEDISTRFFQEIQSIKDRYAFEVLYIPSFFIFTKWFQEYGWLLKWREAKVKIILNMKIAAKRGQRVERTFIQKFLNLFGENQDAINLETHFQFLRWFYIEKSCTNQVLVYCSNPQQYRQKVKNQIDGKYLFTNSQNMVRKFIEFQ